MDIFGTPRCNSQVEDSPAECGPQAKEENDGLGKEEVEGARERHPHHLRQTGTLLFGLDLPADTREALLAHSSLSVGVLVEVGVERLGPPDQQHAAPRLLEPDRSDHQQDAVGDQLNPMDPAPVHVLRDEPAD